MANYTTGINIYDLVQYISVISNTPIAATNSNGCLNTDTVIQFIKEGYQRIVALDGRWPWFQSDYSLTTVEGQRSYRSNFTLTSTTSPTINATCPASGKTLSDIKEIINVVNQDLGGLELIYIDQFKAEQIWNGTSDTPGQPVYWSLWGGGLNIWPKPDDAYSFTIRGYRVPDLSWLNDYNNPQSTNYVDLDQEFHLMLVNFVMMRVFQYQEDPEMAAVYQRHFQEGVAIAKDNITAPNSNQPLVLSGGLQLERTYWNRNGFGFALLPGGPGNYGYGVGL